MADRVDVAGFSVWTRSGVRYRRVVYVAHPLGHGLDRARNLDNAKGWVAWLAERGFAPVAPWIPLAEAWEEDRRTEGLEIDLLVVERCQGVVLCGGRVSPGMSLELEHAKRIGLPYLDLTDMGYFPPI